MFSSLTSTKVRSGEVVNYFSPPAMLIKINEFDHFLSRNSMSRKHMPYDSSSLLRCLSEAIYKSQNRIFRIKEDVKKFLQLVDSKIFANGDLNAFLSDDNKRKVLFEVLASCFEKKIIVYHEVDLKEVQVFGRFDSQIKLVNCLPNHYDLIITHKHLAGRTAAQALSYEHLFTRVMVYPEKYVEKAVREMLEEKKFSKLRSERKRFSRQTRGQPEDLPEELSGLPPIPYKVAKALDTSLYRNVTMDIWLQDHKEVFIASKIVALDVGEECIVVHEGNKFIGKVLEKRPDGTFKIQKKNTPMIISVTSDAIELLSKRKERAIGPGQFVEDDMPQALEVDLDFNVQQHFSPPLQPPVYYQTCCPPPVANPAFYWQFPQAWPFPMYQPYTPWPMAPFSWPFGAPISPPLTPMEWTSCLNED